jgi:hypothetical protein
MYWPTEWMKSIKVLGTGQTMKRKVDENDFLRLAGSGETELIFEAGGLLAAAADLMLRDQPHLAEVFSAAISVGHGPARGFSSTDHDDVAFELKRLAALRLAQLALSATSARSHERDLDFNSDASRLIEIIGHWSRILAEEEDQALADWWAQLGDQHELQVEIAHQRHQLYRALVDLSPIAQPKPIPRHWEALFKKPPRHAGSELEKIISAVLATSPPARYIERKVWAELDGGLWLPDLPSKTRSGKSYDQQWLLMTDAEQAKVLSDARRTLAYWSVAGPAVTDRENQPSPLGALTWGVQADVDFPPKEQPLGRTALDKDLTRLRGLWSSVVCLNPSLAFWVAENCFGPASVSKAVEAIIGFAKPEAEWKAPPGNKPRTPLLVVREWKCSNCKRSFQPGDHEHDSPHAQTTNVSVVHDDGEMYKVYKRVLCGLPKEARPWFRLLAQCRVGEMSHTRMVPEKGVPCWTLGGVLTPVFDKREGTFRPLSDFGVTRSV